MPKTKMLTESYNCIPVALPSNLTLNYFIAIHCIIRGRKKTEPHKFS